MVEHCRIIIVADVVSLEVEIDSFVVACWLIRSKEASLSKDLFVLYCCTCNILSYGDFIFYKL